MRNDKHLAFELRKKGKSYQEIQKELKIPKSTMHYWFRDLDWSQTIKQQLIERALRLSTKRMRAIAKAQKKRWHEWRVQHRKEAANTFGELKPNPLFLAGLMLYWGEGDSNLKNGCVRLANTDPKMISIFSYFLQNVCLIPRDKIKIYMILYPDLNEASCKKFWGNASRIPQNQFQKTQFIQGRHPTKRLSHGICTVNVCSRGLKEKIFVWLNLCQKELLRA